MNKEKIIELVKTLNNNDYKDVFGAILIKVDSDDALGRVLEETVHYYLYQYISGKNKEEN